MTVLAAIAVYGATDYLRAKNALAEFSAKSAAELRDIQKSFPAPKASTAFRPRVP